MRKLVFDTSEAKFLLYSKGFLAGEVALPEKGITFFPPSYDFSGDAGAFIRMRIDFCDGDALGALRKVVDFWRADPNAHALKLVIPGESPRGIEVVPCGKWLAWFFDDTPVGYGPVEITFCARELPASDEPRHSDPQPWVVE